MCHAKRVAALAAFVAGGAFGPATSIASAADKERSDVPDAPPLSFNGVRYQAPAFTRAQDLPHNGGYVEAVDEGTGTRRWIVQVVPAREDDGKESDKRDVFITSLTLAPDGRHLIVSDERGRRYRLDLRTRRVVPLAGTALRWIASSIQSPGLP